jgi:hypothetical protein
MNRRSAIVAMASVATALPQDRDLQGEFLDLLNEFIIAWNEVANSVIRHKGDIQKAKAACKAWDKLTSYSGWISDRK